MEKVGGFYPEDDVLPVTVDGQTRLVVRPRQVVVVAAVEHGVGRLRRRHARQQVLLQPVAIVTDADLELDGRVDGSDHRRVEESRVQTELATSLELLHRQLIAFGMVKVKASHTRCRALGPELIPVYSQSARR